MSATPGFTSKGFATTVEIVAIEGGHCGETEAKPPRYFDGVMNYYERGYADPTAEEMAYVRFEPNPIKYLWTSREDGFFQKGAGGHVPTFAAKVTLTERQFDSIYQFIKNYPYKEYALMGPQCSTFVAEVAEMAGLPLESQAVMQVAPSIFWEMLDPFMGRSRLFYPDHSHSRCIGKKPDASGGDGRS